MPSCSQRLKTDLETHLKGVVASLCSPFSGSRPNPRLQAFLHAAPTALILLAEPWLEKMNGDDKELFLACADLHLYARVLDDAVDEGNEEQRRQLLHLQPYYWRAVQTLSCSKPGRMPWAFSLITETVGAAAESQQTPAGWAKKNHHLLLIPLFLANSMECYHKCKHHLSIAIALLQAEDEAVQGEIQSRTLLFDFIKNAAESAIFLNAHGWPVFAQRILQGCKGMLGLKEV